MLTITVDHIDALLSAVAQAHESVLHSDGPEDDDVKFLRVFTESKALAAIDGHPLYAAILAMLMRGWISGLLDNPDQSSFSPEVCAMHASVRQGLIIGTLTSKPDYVRCFLEGYKSILEGKEPSVPSLLAIEEIHDAD